MAYFLVLDDDMRRRRRNLRMVGSSEDLADVIGVRTFTLKALTVIDASGLTFVHLRSVDLVETDVDGFPHAPAAIYVAG